MSFAKSLPRIFLILFSALLAGGVIIYVFRWQIVDFALVSLFEETEIHQKVASPDGRFIAYYFSHEYGATAASSYFVSIIPGSVKFTDSEKYQVLKARGAESVNMEWKDANHIAITIAKNSRFSGRHLDKLGNITVTCNLE